MPFVFARLCINKEYQYISKLTNKFLKTNVKIPQYIIKQYSNKTGLTPNQIKNYLTKISYNIGYKEKQSLRLFFKLSKGI